MSDDIENLEINETDPTGATYPWPPIPESEITKGTTLTPERLIELGALSGHPSQAQWSFRLLRLRDDIMEKYRVSVRCVKGGLHINTDAEATQYHDGRGEQGVAMIKRQVSHLARLVDPSRLSSAEQAAHDRRLCLWGARLASIKRAAKALPGPSE